MLHGLIIFWFHLVRDWGYLGVIVLMAMESSIFPVPSEVVIPPAAFWAAQGKMDFWGVILAGTVGSYLGSAITYFVAKWVGIPVIKRYGKYFLLSPEKLDMAEEWVKEYSVFGIFFARLLPVVRHLISIPAGILKMNFLRFSLATTIGAFIWCVILAYFGKEVIGAHPELLDSPEAMVHVLKDKLRLVVLAIIAFGFAYGLMLFMKTKLKSKKQIA